MSTGATGTLRNMQGPGNASVAPSASAGIRHIELESAFNMRDIGGYPAAGGHVRWGRVFRADNLSRLTDDDCERMRQLGVTTVLDLRTTNELANGCFPVERIPVTFRHLPFLDEIPDPDRFRLAPGMLARQYLEIAEDAASQVGEALSLLAEDGATPAIIHCAAGKDRTGVLVAVLLALLGIDDAVIVADYALSAAAMTSLRASLVKKFPEGREVILAADEMFSAEPSNMERLLTELRERYGSVEAYAATAGAGPEIVEALRRQLIET